MHDIELNPGPIRAARSDMNLTIISLNCRGLGKVDKFRLLLNKAYELVKKGNFILMLQETMVVDETYLSMAWRGQYAFTPGTGKSQGCITLTNASNKIEHVNHYGNRGHDFILSIPNENPILVVNLYAPNRFDDQKVNFFCNLFDNIGNYDCELIVGGDFNVTLSEQERHCRGVTDGEINVATVIKDYIELLNLHDVWEGKNGHTWRRNKMLSRLDRILTRLANYECRQLSTDWTFTTTDHAAVIAIFKHKTKIKK